MDDGALATEVANATAAIDGHWPWCLSRYREGTDTAWSALPLRAGVCQLRERLIARSMLLVQGAQSARREGNTPVLVLCARAHIESTGALALLVLKLARFRDKKLDTKQWEDAIKRLTLGARTDLGDGIAVKPFSVESLVDAIADAVRLAGVIGPCHLRESYDLSSEWAHPNAGGYVDWDAGTPESVDSVNDAEWITLGSSIVTFAQLLQYLDSEL